MRKVRVNTDKPYDILIERGLIKNIGSLVKDVTNASKITVITDTNVEKFYAESVVSSLEKAGFNTSLFVYEAGERNKNLSTISAMYDNMAEFKMSRKDIVLALGGGVCGDMAGFAAATYMRGIDFVQVPTSLLAQVDSSVGGKTGVDIGAGKNFVGAFRQPILVVIDPDTLDTLPEYYINDGMAEVIKYGCIKDEAFFKTLGDTDALDIIDDVIERCVSIKRDVVVRDEKEAGERMLLNFGHTLGHSLEKIYNFDGLSHGQAVGIGMVMITKASEKAGLSEKGTAEKIIKLLKKYNLPISDNADIKKIAEFCAGDKKAGAGSVNLVLLNKIGASFIKKTELKELYDFINV